MVSKPEITVDAAKTTVSFASSNDSVSVPEPSAFTTTLVKVSVLTGLSATSFALSMVITAPIEADVISTVAEEAATVPVFTTGASPPPPPQAARDRSSKDAPLAFLAFEAFFAAADHFFRKASRCFTPAGTETDPSTSSDASSPPRTSA